MKGYPLIGATIVEGDQSNYCILWVTCAKRRILCECWVQKGGSSVAARVQSWIPKDVMPTAVLLSCQSN